MSAQPTTETPIEFTPYVTPNPLVDQDGSDFGTVRNVKFALSYMEAQIPDVDLGGLGERGEDLLAIDEGRRVILRSCIEALRDAESSLLDIELKARDEAKADKQEAQS